MFGRIGDQEGAISDPASGGRTRVAVEEATSATAEISTAQGDLRYRCTVVHASLETKHIFSIQFLS